MGGTQRCTLGRRYVQRVRLKGHLSHKDGAAVGPFLKPHLSQAVTKEGGRGLWRPVAPMNQTVRGGVGWGVGGAGIWIEEELALGVCWKKP